MAPILPSHRLDPPSDPGGFSQCMSSPVLLRPKHLVQDELRFEHQDSTYYYFVALYGVGVLGDQYLPFKSSRPVSTRNMFLDSGQPPTTAHFDTPRTAREIGS
ncbi:hypothetical protein CRG98_003431 [Punica granatum]|uniref:Uncharacterized protein n=1 Tax=Punica granatum TaxID=22663 RepID=A0A2I0L686_PUNGR|nr:hypothetical protein CRG98_003431 [Punica granatum]